MNPGHSKVSLPLRRRREPLLASHLVVGGAVRHLLLRLLLLYRLLLLHLRRLHHVASDVPNLVLRRLELPLVLRGRPLLLLLPVRRRGKPVVHPWSLGRGRTQVILKRVWYLGELARRSAEGVLMEGQF